MYTKYYVHGGYGEKEIAAEDFICHILLRKDEDIFHSNKLSNFADFCKYDEKFYNNAEILKNDYECSFQNVYCEEADYIEEEFLKHTHKKFYGENFSFKSASSPFSNMHT